MPADARPAGLPPTAPVASRAAPAPLPVGARAPDFALPLAAGRARRLAELRGSPVILAFFPDGWDPARGDELAMYNRLAAAGGVPAGLLGVSLDGPWCDLSFDEGSERVPLLQVADADGDVGRAYGVAGTRALFVLDGDGKVVWRSAGARPSPGDVVAALAGLGGQSLGTAGTAGAGDIPGNEAPPATLSRREFVALGLGAALALTLLPSALSAEPGSTRMIPPVEPPEDSGAIDVRLNVNGRELTLALEPQVTLLDALREYAGLTGTKKGCDHGQCGACTVHVEGRRVLSCLTLAVMQQGKRITTIEGLARGDGANGANGADRLHPLQQAFLDHDGFQCGYCTPGQIMSGAAMMNEPWGPSDDDVREAMSGNICRCGAYPNIVAAVQQVRHGAPPPTTVEQRGGER